MAQLIDGKLISTQIKDELKIMCVLYTEDVGGILTLEFDSEGNFTRVHNWDEDRQNDIDIAFPQVVINYPAEKDYVVTKKDKRIADKFTEAQKEMSQNMEEQHS